MDKNHFKQLAFLNTGLPNRISKSVKCWQLKGKAFLLIALTALLSSACQKNGDAEGIELSCTGVVSDSTIYSSGVIKKGLQDGETVQLNVRFEKGQFESNSKEIIWVGYFYGDGFYGKPNQTEINKEDPHGGDRSNYLMVGKDLISGGLTRSGKEAGYKWDGRRHFRINRVNGEFEYDHYVTRTFNDGRESIDDYKQKGVCEKLKHKF